MICYRVKNALSAFIAVTMRCTQRPSPCYSRQYGGYMAASVVRQRKSDEVLVIWRSDWLGYFGTIIDTCALDQITIDDFPGGHACYAAFT